MNILLLSISILLTGCAAKQHITCWNENTGQINYQGRYNAENDASYIVEVADGVRDFHPKRNCQREKLG